MIKVVPLIILATLTLLITDDTAQAQNFASPLWRAAYWDNRYLAGAPEVIRDESSINYNWGDNSPVSDDIGKDNFSARWTGTMHFNPGTYRFAATSDDGIRVWVNGDLIIDAWHDHPVQTFTGDKNLSAGPHSIKVEYYENEGGAVVQFWWAPAPPPNGNNWRGEYYNNRTLRGNPALVREDPVIGFNWTTVRPGPGVNEDNFSVRWTNTVNLPAGSYRFVMTVDDGGRLWVNGRRLIDAWRVQSPTTFVGDIYLPGGPTPLRMEYFDHLGGALAHLSWSRQQPPPQTGQWRGEYFAGTDLGGAPALVRNEPRINFNWDQSSPAPYQIGVDHFSARWRRTFSPATGTYRFSMIVDDGGRLWIDDRLVIDAWGVQAPTTYTADVYLSGQPTVVRMEYFENTGGAVAGLSWSEIEPGYQTDWRQAIPPQYHAEFRGCLNYLNQLGLQLGASPDWDSLLEQCRAAASLPSS